MSNSLVDGKGNKICNFVPNVDCVIDVRSDRGERLYTNVQIRLYFEDGSFSKTVTVSVTDLEQIKWADIDDRCSFNPEVPQLRIRRYLEEAVRSKKRIAPKRTVCLLNSMGMAIIEGEAVFCTGREVIKPPSSIASRLNIETQLMTQNLDVDAQLSEAQAASGMFDLISISTKPGKIMLAYKLLYLMRHAYIDAGARPNFCIYLHGRTGTQKTTLSSFMMQMYNRKEGIKSPPRLNASNAAAVEILLEAVDDVVVLDDLAPSEFNQVQKTQEETFLEVVRYVADGTVPARMRGKNLSIPSPKCGVIFTGEYIIGSGSDAARLLPIEMMQPDSEKLKYFQDHPLIVSTFYDFYIRWFVENYKDIVLLLKSWLAQYRKEDIGVHDRLQEMHFFLNTSYSMLLQYCCEKNFLSKRDAARLHRNFLETITVLVRQQQKRVQPAKTRELEAVDYLGRICALYRNRAMAVADSTKQFNENIHDGILHNECLCLRGNKLAAYFSGVGIAEIADSLFSQGALKTGKDNRTIQISALHGKRFYAIPLNRLG